MSAEARYYYVDAQNQATGPIAMAGLLALKNAGTVTDATLVVAEGGAEWVAFSALKPAAAAPVAATPQPGAGAEALRSPAPAPGGIRSDGGSSSSTAIEPVWASQLSQKVDRLVATMERLIVSLEKSRPAAPIAAPATAALHAEKINLNPAPKPGIATAPSSGPAPAPFNPAGTMPRTGVGTSLTPLAVPANAQKSPLPLPNLGTPPTSAAVPGKGNIFSKFLKK